MTTTRRYTTGTVQQWHQKYRQLNITGRRDDHDPEIYDRYSTAVAFWRIWIQQDPEKGIIYGSDSELTDSNDKKVQLSQKTNQYSLSRNKSYFLITDI